MSVGTYVLAFVAKDLWMTAQCVECGAQLAIARKLLGRDRCVDCQAQHDAELEAERERQREAHADAVAAYEEVLDQLQADQSLPIVLARVRKARELTPLPREVIDQLHDRAVVRYLDELLADDILTNTENRGLVAVCQMFGRQLSDGDCRRYIVAACNSGFPPGESDPVIFLEQGEAAYFRAAVHLLAEKVVKEYRTNHQSISFPVGNSGVRYRAGQSRGRTVVVGTSVERADRGWLTITDRRIVFSGEKQVMEFPLRRLVGLHVFEDGLGLQIANRKTVPTFQTGPGSNDAVAAVINLAAARHRGTFVPPRASETRLADSLPMPRMLSDAGYTDPADLVPRWRQYVPPDRAQRASAPAVPPPPSSPSTVALPPPPGPHASSSTIDPPRQPPAGDEVAEMFRQLEKVPGLLGHVGHLRAAYSLGAASRNQIEQLLERCFAEAATLGMPPALTAYPLRELPRPNRPTVREPSEEVEQQLHRLGELGLTQAQIAGLRSDYRCELLSPPILVTLERMLIHSATADAIEAEHGQKTSAAAEAPAEHVVSTRTDPDGPTASAFDNLEACHPRTAANALAALEALWPLDPGRLATLRTLCAQYARLGVLSDSGSPSLTAQAPALHEQCPNAEACWRAPLRSGKGPPKASDALSISLPYIGDEYDSSRIVLVGLNTRCSAGLIVLWKILAKALQDIASDARPARFVEGAAQAVQAVLRHNGYDADAGDSLRRVAFLQAVKCGVEDGHRGTPSGEMCRRCPPHFLRGEIDELQPRGVITFGWSCAEPIRNALGISGEGWNWVATKRLEHGRFDYTGGSAWLISLSHPSAPREWAQSMRLLDETLRSGSVGRL